MSLEISISKDWRKLLQFGSGVGIEIGATDLEVVAARVRPNGVRVLGRLAIADFAARPAAEWGAEYARFLKPLGLSHLSATVLLPRREVIVRQMALPGVAGKDVEGAIRFQLDSLHPYGEDDVAWGWSPLAYGAVLIGIVRRATVTRYLDLFLEAGIAVASFTFSAAAVHSAIRLNGGGRRDGFLALSRTASGGVEVYGESQARPVFSAEFDLTPERAALLGLAELRLAPETEPLKLEDVLPIPAVNPVENDLSRNARPYATALAGACPRLAPAANMLSPAQRQASSRAVFIPTVVLAAILLLVAGAVVVYSSYADRRYLRAIEAEIAKEAPAAQRADELDRLIRQARERSQLLDQFRNQTRADLEALNELTRLVEPPAWITNATLARDSVRIAGEAPQAAPLLKILDSSPLFENSAIESSAKTNGGAGETFQIRANRKYPAQ
jgi:type II secretory pathway component PulL